MKCLFSEEHIYLDKEDIKKVSDFFEKEFGITNITAIKATTDSFEIVRLRSDDDSTICNFIKAYNEYCKKVR